MGAALLMASWCAAAQIVECVDANGKKTYAQSCQDEADKKRDIPVPKAPPKPDDSAWRAKDTEFEKRRQERLKAQDRDAAQQQHSEQDVQDCADARRRLAAMETGKQKNRVDPVTGEHISPDGDQAQLDALRQIIQHSCQ